MPLPSPISFPFLHSFPFPSTYSPDPAAPTHAGTGGDEASIFAGDLIVIYKKYAESLGWKVTTVSETEGEMGGYKTAILQVRGGVCK